MTDERLGASREQLRAAIDAISDQLCEAVGGRFDFIVKSPAQDENVDKLTMLVNFVIEAARRSMGELENRIEERTVELKAEKERAQEANRAKDSFLANMSHEVRTPLGAMIGFTELVLESPSLGASEKAYLSTILRNGRQLLRIVNEILDISKVESDRLGVEKIRFDLPQLLKDVESLLGLQASDKRLRLRIPHPQDLPRYIVSDSMRLRQILINVIGNAIKFTEEGAVDVTITASPAETGGHLFEFRISDTGIGITAAQATRLFQPFSQGDSSTTRRFGGTGLGLYLSKKLAQLLGGDLELLNSEKDKGSVFRLTIRAEIPEASTIVPIEVKTPSPAVRRRRLRVLVVDDSADNRTLAGHLVSAMGFEVDFAEDGRRGAHKAMASEFDVVLMDLQMPEMDGFEALETLRAQGYPRAVVALTAHAMKGDRERCLARGFDGYLVKPIDRKVFEELLEDYASRA